MFVALVDILIKPADVAEFVAYREQHVNPDMAATGAFAGSHLLRSVQPADAEGREQWLLVNAWQDREVQRRFATSSSHAAQLAEMKRLIRIIAGRSVKRLDNVSYRRRDRGPAHTWVFEYHRCHPGRGGDYQAALVDIPKKVDEVSGCVGLMVYADNDSPDSFVLSYRWNDDVQDVDAGTAQAELADAVAHQVRDTVADGLGATTWYSELYQWRR